jgi:hypothetical protein
VDGRPETSLVTYRASWCRTAEATERLRLKAAAGLHAHTVLLGRGTTAWPPAYRLVVPPGLDPGSGLSAKSLTRTPGLPNVKAEALLHALFLCPVPHYRDAAVVNRDRSGKVIMDSMYRRRTDRSDSSWTTNSSKSSSSSVFRTRKVPSYEKQALEQERAAQSARHQWVCSRYEMTWDVLEQFLHRIFPNEIFHEFQVSLLVFPSSCW